MDLPGIYSRFSVAGKKALVTGGSTGIGRALAEALIEGGAEVAIAARSARVFDVAQEIGAAPLQVDLADRPQALGLVERAIAHLGQIDVLVNAAGTQRRHRSENFPLEDWDHVLAINLNAMFITCQAAGRHMLERGYGKIVNIASACSFVGGITIPAYSASKGGVAQLTKALCNDWASRGINVNAIVPGYVDTEMTSALVGNPNREPAILARIATGRWGVPDDLKGAVVFLSSAASDYVNGAIIPVDGGYLSM